MDELRLSSKRRDGFVIVAVGGELDVVTSRQFDEYLAQTRGEDDRVILDLSAVDFMDTGSEERRVVKECRSRWSPYH